MSARKRLSDDVVALVLTKSRRRCALCFGLQSDDFPKLQGQIAHIDRDSSNASVDNLVYLCITHHDQYDTVPRQTKGLTVAEIKHYRDLLYSRLGTLGNAISGDNRSNTEEWSALSLLGGQLLVCQRIVAMIKEVRLKARLNIQELERICTLKPGTVELIENNPQRLSSEVAIILMSVLNISLDSVMPLPNLLDDRLQKWRVYLRNLRLTPFAGDFTLSGDTALTLFIQLQAIQELDGRHDEEV